MSDGSAPAANASTAPVTAAAVPEAKPAAKRRRILAGYHDDGQQPTEEWMLSYSDMVTLLLTMFIALLLNADFTKTVRGGDAGGGGGQGALAGASTAGEGGGKTGVDRSGGADKEHGAGANVPGGTGGEGHGGNSSGSGGGMKGTLQEWFHLNVTSPYTDNGGYILAMRDVPGAAHVPQDADLAVIKDQDLAQIAFREQTLASIRGKLAEAGIDKYVTADIEGEGIRLNIPNAILFALGSAEFASEGTGVIRAIVPIVAHNTYTISVEGHTDNAPIRTDRFPSNWELSAQRAASVVRIMVEAGIAPKRLEAVGLADTQPLVVNDTPEARAQNRRVTIFLRF